VVRVIEEVDDASPDSRVESVRADGHLDAVATPLLRWKIVAVVSRGAPVAGFLAVTRRLAVDIQTVAALAAEDEAAPQQILFWVCESAS